MKDSDMHLYSKEFLSFTDGIVALQTVCLAVSECIKQAVSNYPTIHKSCFQSEELWYLSILVSQASEAPLQSRIYVRANRKGFVYVTRSGFAFGWRRLEQGYRFGLQFEQTKIRDWVPEMVQKIESDGWSRQPWRYYAKPEGFISIPK